MNQRTCTYFVSDLHIGAGYIDNRIEHERTLVNWFRSIAPTAKAIYLLGDVLDYWYEYRTVVPRGYVRFFGVLAELADQGIEITWMKGNHDIWIFDYLPTEIGLTVADGVVDCVIDNHRFVMEHGDGVGELRSSYRFMRKGFRNKFLQWLYAGIHPRWTVGFAHRWSKHSRLNPSFVYSNEIPNDDPLIKFALDYTQHNGHVDFFVFGHRHILFNQEIAPNSHLIILGDGFKQMTYGIWDGHNFTLKRMCE